MDRIKEGANVIAQINKYRQNEIDDAKLVSVVSEYFDLVKRENLSSADLKFLKYVSNIAGVPHYFDMLKKFQKHKDNNQEIFEINEINLNTLSSFVYESSLHVSDDIKVHKYQKEILSRFKKRISNRYFLSASTSFGKTFLVYEIIKKMEYKNVVLLFPTIALLAENLERIISDDQYEYFEDNYKIHTLSELNELGEKNLFIYTPERFLSFIEKNSEHINFDFVFIDEAYKIDNEYYLDEVTKENERDVAYRIATHYSLFNNSDILLAGPYIKFSNSEENSFRIFLTRNNIALLNFNEIEIVGKKDYEIKNARQIEIEENFVINFEDNNKTNRLVDILRSIKQHHENSIVYCSTKALTENYVKKVIRSGVNQNWDTSKYNHFIRHLKDNFDENWSLIKGLEHGIGIHHGLIPKYIQKEIISLFNAGNIKTLFSTTTITEGVNTEAKNIIILHDKKGNKDLKKFDAQNIAGRAGRFLAHFNGRVIVLQNRFLDVIKSVPEEIKHKNYDINSPKDEIDLFYTDNQFLNTDDLQKKTDIKTLQQERNIPDEIIQRFKVVSRKDKITVYDSILKLTQEERRHIRMLVQTSTYSGGIDWGGLQIILNLIEPIVKNEKLKRMIQKKLTSSVDSKEYSVFIYLLYFYLKDGFRGSMKYKIKKGEGVDKAIRDTADFIFSILKYQAVKYLGVFNLMYKFIRSQEENKDFDDISGIDKLLLKLEYNALTESGRLASDYGVSHNILEYYELLDEKPDIASEIKKGFDDYEKEVFDRVKNIINNS